jgi:hypothetical protein
MIGSDSDQRGGFGLSVLSESTYIRWAIPVRQYRLSTIGDVTAAAWKAWPDAVEVNVALDPSNSLAQKMYRVSALGPRSRLLGRLDGPSLNKLKALLETRVATQSKERQPPRTQKSPTCANCGAPAQIVISLGSQDNEIGPGPADAKRYITVECQFCGKVQQETSTATSQSVPHHRV